LRDDARPFRREGETAFRRKCLPAKKVRHSAGFAKKRKDGFSAPSDFGAKRSFLLKRKGF
jgi:hypothetical protein